MMLTDLEKQYDEGICVVPPPGRYAVEMLFYNQGHRILEKKIFRGRGCNHLPVFALRHFKIVLMDFSIHVAGDEVIFKYLRIPLEDRLKKIGRKQWTGRIFWKGTFIDYFLLTKV